MTITQALNAATARLREAGFDTPRLDAEVLLRHVLGLDRTALLQRLREPVSPDSVDRFAALIEQRLAGQPVAYLTGEREFMGLPFVVAPGVLVPRPETELMVEWSLAWLAGRSTAQVIDVGTGSGAIALSLAAQLPPSWQGRIIAADVSRPALAIATANRHRLALDERVRLVRGDLVGWCATADLILANLPYLRPEQVANNRDLTAEPAMALLGGDDGLAVIRRLVADLPRVLASGGAVALEIDPSQADDLTALLAETLPAVNIQTHADLAGLARFITAERTD